MGQAVDRGMHARERCDGCCRWCQVCEDLATSMIYQELAGEASREAGREADWGSA